eukprot:SAG22_NODE_1948_length_3277_cov_1.569541_3_plen_178_part_00
MPRQARAECKEKRGKIVSVLFTRSLKDSSIAARNSALFSTIRPRGVLNLSPIVKQHTAHLQVLPADIGLIRSCLPCRACLDKSAAASCRRASLCACMTCGGLPFVSEEVRREAVRKPFKFQVPFHLSFIIPRHRPRAQTTKLPCIRIVLRQGRHQRRYVITRKCLESSFFCLRASQR